jgi:hypothetical protein
MALDYSKPPQDLMVALINLSNNTALNTAVISCDSPTPNPAFPLSSPRDTLVTVSARAGSRYTGQVVMAYKRVPMAVVPGTRSKFFDQGNALSAHSLLAVINARYGVRMTASELVDTTLPLLSTYLPLTPKSVVLQAKPGALVYTGDLTIQLAPGAKELSEVVDAQPLTGLDFLVNPARTDFTQAANLILVSLVNYSKGLGILPSEVTFGQPASIGGNPNWDTLVPMIGVNTPGFGYKNDVILKYKRVPVDITPQAASRIFDRSGHADLVSLLPTINARFGLQLSTNDVTNQALPVATGQQSLAIPINFESLIYVGTLNLVVNNPQVGDPPATIVDPVLDGFDYATRIAA